MQIDLEDAAEKIAQRLFRADSGRKVYALIQDLGFPAMDDNPRLMWEAVLERIKEGLHAAQKGED